MPLTPRRPPKPRPPARAQAVTPIAFVHAILLGYARRGADPTEVLRQGQITPRLLRDPSARITARQLEIVSEGAMRQLDDEALGWFSRPLRWGSLGMLCRASLPSPDLHVALRRWFRHHRLLVDDLSLELEVAPGRATISIREHVDLGAMREFCLLSYLRYVHGYACWAVDSRISLLEVGLPFPRPPHGDVYPLLFPGPVRFDAGRAHLDLDPKYLALPQRRDDAALRAMLKNALPLTVHVYRRDKLLVARLRRILAEHPHERHDAGALARLLHVSIRTLHRQLAQEGASLQALKDEARREHAIALLCRSERPLKDVAREVGFADAKSFSRAFAAWTGRAPGEYRRTAAPRAG